ncbi:MAG: M18 family aminopeptidase [Kofleriaceae bacterium]
MVTDLLDFLHHSPSPYHAVDSAVQRLRAAGFQEVHSGDAWRDVTSSRCYFRHGDSALFAWVLPRVAPRAVHLLGAHTDSPNLRVKPKGVYSKEGYGQLGVEVYGGVLLNSWLDRDLGIAGRVLIERDGEASSHLVRVDRPLARVPQLAIHLDREVNDRGVVLNRQEHLAPIWTQGSVEPADLLGVMTAGTDIDPSTIVSHDLMLYDLTAPALAGRDQEFLLSARLDDLAMCHSAVQAMIAAAPAVEDGARIAMMGLLDHEEVGSQSAHGAGSAMVPYVIERVAASRGIDREGFLRLLAGSLCVSADMAHAIHPNYSDRHEARHRPQLNHGPVLKINAQQRYATSGRGAAEFARWCKAADVPHQTYVHRTDLPCGSTIGPITATQLGLETVDLGNAMLSMHSAREMAGAKDPELMVRVMTAFLTTPVSGRA